MVRELLIDRLASDRVKSAAAGVPRSTFQLVRSHAFSQGWLLRRYVPSPSAVGVIGIRVEVVQPFAEWRNELFSRMVSRPDVVVLWDSPSSLLSVSFDRVAEPDDSPESGRAEWSRRWSISAKPASNEVPVYFDYEGAWSRVALDEPPRAYPRGLPPPGGPLGRRMRIRMADVAELVRRPLSDVDSKMGSRWGLTRGLPRHLQRVIDQGLVIPRTFPNFARMPMPPGRSLVGLVLASGLWETREGRDRLLTSLMVRSQATPFLCALDQSRLILGLLAPAPPNLAGHREPIARVLSEELRQVEVIREPIQSIVTPIDHRYDRLFRSGELNGAPKSYYSAR